MNQKTKCNICGTVFDLCEAKKYKLRDVCPNCWDDLKTLESKRNINGRSKKQRGRK